MQLTSFYPGPSRVYSNLTEYLYDAHRSGILSVNHRSEPFMDLYEKTVNLVKNRLKIPDDYTLAFISAATEAWEITAQSLTYKRSAHVYNGAFGEKWAQYAASIHDVVPMSYDFQKLPALELNPSADLLCLVHNETSNATRLPTSYMSEIRASFDGIIAVDATSSMAGEDLPWREGDVWFASVQKCFGLPAGMAVMVVSPRARDRAKDLGNNHYNSLHRILTNADKFQTHHTPNVLGIYLLYRSQRVSKGIERVQQKLQRRYEGYRSFFEGAQQMKFLVENEEVRSRTVLALQLDDPGKWLKQAESFGLLLGKGYGELKDQTFRIANFPALKGREVDRLKRFFVEQDY